MAIINVDLRSRTPLSQQLVDNISSLVLHGYIAPDEQLPSVRALAAELGINPNTIQKAYAILEAKGIVYSLPGRGSYASPNVCEAKEKKARELREKLQLLLTEAQELGMERREIETVLNGVFGEKL